MRGLIKKDLLMIKNNLNNIIVTSLFSLLWLCKGKLIYHLHLL